MEGAGELLAGFGYVHTDGSNDYEFQAEYRFKFGLCLGAGMVKSGFFESPAGPQRTNDFFAKASYRNDFGTNWKYTVTAQVQEVDGDYSPGGFLALYNGRYLLQGGYDGELWRTAASYIHPKKSEKVRPALEVLYIDKSIGNNEVAPTILWVNGTLNFKGGFLSNAGTLGRAMGATGLEYGNPLPYLIPLNDGNPYFPGSPAIWNRALNVWELGGLLNFRLFHLGLPGDSKWGRVEGCIFPFNWTRNNISATTFLWAATTPTT